MIGMKDRQYAFANFMQNCSANEPLKDENIWFLDELTQAYGKSNDVELINMANSAWCSLEKSSYFWENMGNLSLRSKNEVTKIQVMIFIQKRIQSNWSNEEEGLKNELKGFLWDQFLGVESSSPSGGMKTYFRKVNSVLAEILKYEWSSQSSSFLTNLYKMLKDNIQNPDKQAFAENSFDLMKIIFDEVFEEGKITSREKDILKAHISSSANFLQDIFQLYLRPHYRHELKQKCLLAIESVLQWVNPGFFYFGTFMQNLLALVGIANLQTRALDCLIIALKFSFPQNLFNMHRKKRRIIWRIAENVSESDSGSLKFLQIATIYFEEQTRLVDEVPIGQLQKDEQFIKENLEISRKAFSILQCIGSPEQHFPLFMMLYKDSKDIDLEDFTNTIVEMVPCPIEPELLLVEKYIDERSYNEEMEDLRCQFIHHFNNMSFFQERMMIIQNELATLEVKTIKNLHRFCQIIWYLYYSTDENNLMPLMFTIDKLVQIGQKIMSKKFLTMTDEKTRHCIDIFLLLLTSHPKIQKKPQLAAENFNLIGNFLVKDTNQVKILISIIMNFLDSSTKKVEILNQIREAIRTREDRYEINIYLFQRLGEWHKKQNSPIPRQVSQSVVWFLLNWNEKIRNIEKVAMKRNQIESLKLQYIKESVRLVDIFSLSVPLINSKMIEDYEKQISSIEAAISISQDVILTQAKEETTAKEETITKELCIEFLIKAALFYEKLFATHFISNCLYQKIYMIVRIWLEILPEARARQDKPDFMESSMKVLGCILNKVSTSQMELGQKVLSINDTVSRVEQLRLEADTPGYSIFARHIISSKCFTLLNEQLERVYAEKIYIFSHCEMGLIKEQSIEMMKEVLKYNEEDSDQVMFIRKYLVSFFRCTFRAIVSCKLGDAYLHDYCQVLAQLLKEKQKLKWIKLGQDKYAADNGEIISSIYDVASHVASFKKDISASINQILDDLLNKSLSLVQVEERIHDFLVHIHRGY